MKKSVLALLFTVIALIFIVISLFGPWYNFQLEVKSNITQNNMNYDIDFYLSKAVIEGEVFGNTISQNYDYTNIRQLFSQIPGYNEQSSTLNQVLGIFDITSFIVILTELFSIFTLICSAGTIFYIRYFSFLKKLNMLFSVFTFSFALCAIFYFMFFWNNLIQRGISLFLSVNSIILIPSKITDMSFWYYFNLGGTEISMGAGFAWYLLIFAAIFGLIAFILNYKTVKPKNLSDL